MSDAGRAVVEGMAAASSTEEVSVTPSDVYRTLLAEATRARAADCARAHRGPVRLGRCGHCGRTT